MTTVTLKDSEVNLVGEFPAIGSVAPDFILVDATLADRSLADYQGKKKLLSIVPSLDTEVCAASTKKISAMMTQNRDLAVLVISADLPFAMTRFCDSAKIDNVTFLSMMRSKHFAKDYGVLIADGPLAGLTTRAVIVLDEENKVVYTELVPEITHQPDYDRALSAIDSV